MRARLALGWLLFLALPTLAGPVGAGSLVVATLDGHRGSIQCMAFSPDGKTLAVGGGVGLVSGEVIGHVTLWEANTHQLRGTLGGHRGAVCKLAFAPDGNILATADGDTARIWNLRGGRERVLLKGNGGLIPGLAFSPDGKTLATGSEGKRSVKFWETVTGQERARLPEGSGTPLGFVAEGKRLMTILSDTMQLWDVPQGKRRLAFPATNWGYSLALSPDGRLLAAGSESDGGWLWETATGKLRFAFPRGASGC
jgi:WD40 repeat protein